MKKFLFWFKMFLVSFIPVSCHGVFTSPALIDHGSSSAFNLWMFLWIVTIAFPCFILIVFLKEKRII